MAMAPPEAPTANAEARDGAGGVGVAAGGQHPPLGPSAAPSSHRSAGAVGGGGGLRCAHVRVVGDGPWPCAPRAVRVRAAAPLPPPPQNAKAPPPGGSGTWDPPIGILGGRGHDGRARAARYHKHTHARGGLKTVRRRPGGGGLGHTSGGGGG